MQNTASYPVSRMEIRGLATFRQDREAFTRDTFGGKRTQHMTNQRNLRIAIIGAGASGMMALIKLREAGIGQHDVTSPADLGITATMEDVDVAMKKTFAKAFGCDQSVRQ